MGEREKVDIYDPAVHHAIKEIILERFQVWVSANIAEEVLNSNFRPVVKVTADRMYQQIRIYLKGDVFGQKLEEFKHPADWKEAFKERWFPEWYKRRKPVKYTTFQIRAFYPEIAFPKEARVTVAKLDAAPLMPWETEKST